MLGGWKGLAVLLYFSLRFFAFVFFKENGVDLQNIKTERISQYGGLKAGERCYGLISH